MNAPQFTPGPWLAAAIPSSVVGWPVVAPHKEGRVVCKIVYADKGAFGGPQPGDRAFNAESKANACLIAAAPDLLAAAEAQEELVNYVGDDARPAIKRVQEMRRAAILKARGEQ